MDNEESDKIVIHPTFKKQKEKAEKIVNEAIKVLENPEDGTGIYIPDEDGNMIYVSLEKLLEKFENLLDDE